MSSKTADPNRIANLVAMAEAARAEFDQAAALHESWKIMAFDGDLHMRMGTSRATTTFRLIRNALRREVILSLMKLWDRVDGPGISMTRLLRALEDPAVLAVFADKVRRLDAQPPDDLGEDMPEETRAKVREAFIKDERLFGCLLAANLLKEVEELRALLRRYDPSGDGRQTFDYLKHLRNERLAHRQVRASEVGQPGGSGDDNAIERFYQDMSKAVRGMFVVVTGIDYRPEDTAELRREHALLFWNGVRGERTEGHPDYRKRP